MWHSVEIVWTFRPVSKDDVDTCLAGVAAGSLTLTEWVITVWVPFLGTMSAVPTLEIDWKAVEQRCFYEFASELDTVFIDCVARIFEEFDCHTTWHGR